MGLGVGFCGYFSMNAPLSFPTFLLLCTQHHTHNTQARAAEASTKNTTQDPNSEITNNDQSTTSSSSSLSTTTTDTTTTTAEKAAKTAAALSSEIAFTATRDAQGRVLLGSSRRFCGFDTQSEAAVVEVPR